MKLLIRSVILLTICSTALCEIFTALADMEEVLETEVIMINNLEGYIEAQETKLRYLKRKVQEYQREHDEAAKDFSSYLTNPINAYLLTKRLTSDWREIEKIMTNDVGTAFIQNVTNYREVLTFPSDEDLNGAAVALTRLQDTYNLDTGTLARGMLNGIQYSTEMSAGDCFELGKQSYLNNDFYHTVLWMQESLDRLTNESSVTRADILEYLAFSTFKEGNVKNALNMTNELLELSPNHDRARGNKVYYELELSKVSSKSRLRGDDGSAEVPKDKSVEVPVDTDVEERVKYEMACRGETKPSPSILAKLKCRYEHKNNPFLKIAPFKIEEAYLEPYIVLYHNVMSDKEIEVVKTMAKPRFRRAKVQNHKTGELEIAQYRISKSAWLKDDEDEVIEAISLRIDDMTGLSMETAEDLQVVNYGIGGHYAPHYDFARKEEVNAFKSLGSGNRIATVLFYISDVQQGGATVFPALDIALWPQKSSAAVWMNLKKSGQGDYMTRHAACPVLVGSKWVANKWIHEQGNEFRRPCGLQIDHDMEF